MSGVLEERYGVSISGVSWDSGPFKLWQAQNDDIILFSTKQPMLAKSLGTGRYEAAMTEMRAQKDGTYKIVGGSAAFTITSAIQFDEGQFQALQDQWRQIILGSPDAKTKNPKFVPLNTRKGTTEIAIPAISGKPTQLSLDAKDAGTPGGTVTYMVDLTPEGAQEWAQAVRQHSPVVAQIMMTYEYLRYMPTCAVEILLHGNRVFQHFSGELKASYDGLYYGGSVDIQAQLESLRADGSIEMHFIGLDDLPGGMEKIKENVINTVVDQGLKAILGMLFTPKPDVKPAQAGSSGGIFGGANLALKWQRQEQAADISTKLEFGGFTWLTERADPDVGSFFAVLDDSYVNEVNTELQFPATVTVVGDPQVATTAVAWSSDSGHGPESPVFSTNGGTMQYIVTSATPDDVKISYTAKIDYAPPQWPIVTTTGNGKVKDGLQDVLIKPSAWIGSTTIYLYVKDTVKKGIKLVTSSNTNDYLVVNVSYAAPNLSLPIKASSRLSLDNPVTFSYPLDPQGRPGTAKFSAFGVIGGKLLSAPEQPIKLDEQAVFVLVSDTIQLVSADAVLTEDDTTAKDLLSRGDGVKVTTTTGGVTTETGKAGAAATTISGILVATEYAADGTSIWLDTDTGQNARILLAYEGMVPQVRQRTQVNVKLDKQGRALDIMIPLVAAGQEVAAAGKPSLTLPKTA